MAEKHYRESVIEDYFCKEVAKKGGEAEKFVSPQRKNVPDRQALWEGGIMDYVELKATGEEANDGQKRDHKRRRAMGFRVFVLNSHAAVDWYIDKGRWLSFTEYMNFVKMEHPWCV